ncbi:hypothetical protein F4678DRAFT_247910 [Xylaria arbuscula]|nr:hypothetical protein F4678DRAFT_247910 [Xylaria arbuscula]
MMFGQVIAIVLVTLLSLVSAQDAAPSVCSAGCVNGVFVNAANIGCASGDTACVCGKTDQFYDGIRDCITQACASDGPDTQIPLAEAYANQLCASAAASSSTPPPAPTSSAQPASPESTPTEAAPIVTTTAAVSSPTSSPSEGSTSQSTVVSPKVASTEVTSSTSSPQATTTSASGTLSDKVSSPTNSASTSASTSTSSSSPSATSESSSESSQSAATNESKATTGLSTAVKAGIGAGVGAAALAAILITVCVCLRRRQRNKTASRVRNYKISEPMAVSDRHFGNDIGRTEAGLPKPIITTLPVRPDAAMATSPTSLYSNSSDLESHARRYEDMPPRTQPRTMI